MYLSKNGHILPLVVEESAYAGVRRVAGKVADDIEKVCGARPEILDSMPDAPHVLCGTLGCSPAIDRLIASGKLPQAEQIRDKWECYAIAMVGRSLVIAGSDKRGTIYGMFALSEYIGVSPLCWIGDVEPVERENIRIDEDICRVSKEPSVKYRGFFINDEWPCFGTWTTTHFGGFTAEMYDHVFELLLRLKGNYFWPAMWTSSFAVDGPLNEQLADEYGVVVGNSHHEPCLRAGEEFKHSIEADGKYGTDWNFVRNRDGITRFWADGLKRSGQYEHLITIGMRGEADSAMLGEDSGLRANIEYLKDVITTQEALIREHAGPKSADLPRVLALYKEVEPFFYGNETVQGLKDWDGLTNTVCMLCEDNHGFMRSLPTPEMTASLQKRGCGWGMYYHVDYHGGPTSYEWMPSTPFSKLWEQMCLAYDSGIRDVWILNTGDLKGNEVSLNQFLDLAYDYERWGSHLADNWMRWLMDWTERTFPGLKEEQQEHIADLLNSLYTLNGKRRPEALHAGVYHPCHENESRRMLDEADELLGLNEYVLSQLDEPHHTAMVSLVDFPVRCSVNLLQMHLCAGLNAHYAAQGRPEANVYAQHVSDTLELDEELCQEYADFRDGKWRGMEQEAHIGFTSWNEDGCLMPTRTYVTPWHHPRLSISRADDARVYGRTYFGPMVITVDDFCDAGVDTVLLEVANAGSGKLHYTIEGAPNWLMVSPAEGNVETLDTIYLDCFHDRLGEGRQTATLTCRTDEATVLIKVSAQRPIRYDEPTHLPRKGMVTMDAEHFVRKHDAKDAAFRVLEGYGRSGSAVKVYPTMAAFPAEGDAPSLTYRFHAESEGPHTIELWLTPTAPVQPGIPMRCGLMGPDGATQIITCVPADYRPGENSDTRWCLAVTDHIRKVRSEISCTAGQNEVTVSAIDPNFSLERLLVYPAGHHMPESYLGPAESARSCN